MSSRDETFSELMRCGRWGAARRLLIGQIIEEESKITPDKHSIQSLCLRVGKIYTWTGQTSDAERYVLRSLYGPDRYGTTAVETHAYLAYLMWKSDEIITDAANEADAAVEIAEDACSPLKCHDPGCLAALLRLHSMPDPNGRTSDEVRDILERSIDRVSQSLAGAPELSWLYSADLAVAYTMNSLLLLQASQSDEGIIGMKSAIRYARKTPNKFVCDFVYSQYARVLLESGAASVASEATIAKPVKRALNLPPVTLLDRKLWHWR
jgi:hypothetical protein